MKAAVLGSPVAHSLSPVLHRAAYAHLHLDWTYEAHEVDEAALPAFVAGLGPEWAGLSLTMPLKSAVLPLLDEVDEVAVRAGAVNTVLLTPGHRAGVNTDVPGLVAALAERGVGPSDTGEAATVLGAGATARSVLVGLADSGWQTANVYARRPERSAGLHDAVAGSALAVTVRPWADAPAGLAARLVVSTVPAGAADELAQAVPAAPGALLDVVYAPWPTPLAAGWLAAGGTVVGGLDLLVHQAARQVVLMTGLHVPLDQLVAVLRSSLAADPPKHHQRTPGNRGSIRR